MEFVMNIEEDIEDLLQMKPLPEVKGLANGICTGNHSICKRETDNRETVPYQIPHLGTEPNLRLADHLVTHSEEKVIGCSTCLATFANKTKFADHRKRQQPSHTFILMLNLIIALLTTKHNLDAYIRIHNKENPIKSDTCDFSCRTKIGLNNYHVKQHGAASSCYVCHCCERQSNRGSYLTRHLVKEHNCFLAQGHARFRYWQDRDGFHRLQTIRYETLEAAQQVNKPTPRCDDENVQFLVEHNMGEDGMSVQISSR
ncbi:histone H4 transcription factor-like [Leptinotarsa decemlineata]|uniref:histone H4 transcription factor-like n=1 Tax=Leptinotarsa decemlineata TaxID=7539 RepID=UPI003D305BC8